MESNGRVLQDGLKVMIEEAGLPARIRCLGRPQWSLLKFLDRDGKEDLILRNLFQQEAVKRGVLVISTHNMTAAHNGPAVQKTLEVYAEVLKTLGCWIEDGVPARFLEGKMSQPVFRVR
jgi:glutamate-1-semialdehyde 2,1-aminomutase